MENKSVEDYERALGMMKALPDSDPRSFTQQAAIHQAYCDGHYRYDPTEKNAPFDVHFSWIFAPWHRMYIYFYERILGDLIDDPNFALPYWNWDAPAGMALPAMFKDKDSPLYDANRRPAHVDAYVDLDFLKPGDKTPVLFDKQAVKAGQYNDIVKKNLNTIYNQRFWYGAAIRSSPSTAAVVLGARSPDQKAIVLVYGLGVCTSEVRRFEETGGESPLQEKYNSKHSGSRAGSLYLPFKYTSSWRFYAKYDPARPLDAVFPGREVLHEVQGHTKFGHVGDAGVEGAHQRSRVAGRPGEESGRAPRRAARGRHGLPGLGGPRPGLLLAPRQRGPHVAHLEHPLGGRNFSDPEWLDTSFAFYDEKKQLVRLRVRDVLDTTNLGYTYADDDEPLLWLDSKPTVRRGAGAGAAARSGRVAPTTPVFPLTLTEDKVVVVPGVARPRKGKGELLALVFDAVEFDPAETAKFDVAVNVPPELAAGVGPDCVEYAGIFSSLARGGDENSPKTLVVPLELPVEDVLTDIGVGDQGTVDVVIVPRTSGITINSPPRIESRNCEAASA
ncbi:hypothetical protein EJB05_09595, partial [Eragrostis curvula]